MRVCTQHKHNKNTAENGADECQSTRHRSIHTSCPLFPDIRLKWGSIGLLHWCVGRLVAVSAGCDWAVARFVSRQSVAIARDEVDAAPLWCAGLGANPLGGEAAPPSRLHGFLTQHAGCRPIAVQPGGGVGVADAPRVRRHQTDCRAPCPHHLPCFVRQRVGEGSTAPVPHTTGDLARHHSTHRGVTADSTRRQTGRTHAMSARTVTQETAPSFHSSSAVGACSWWKGRPCALCRGTDRTRGLHVCARRTGESNAPSAPPAGLLLPSHVLPVCRCCNLCSSSRPIPTVQQAERTCGVCGGCACSACVAALPRCVSLRARCASLCSAPVRHAAQAGRSDGRDAHTLPLCSPSVLLRLLPSPPCFRWPAVPPCMHGHCSLLCPRTERGEEREGRHTVPNTLAGSSSHCQLWPLNRNWRTALWQRVKNATGRSSGQDGSTN
jgi:hypothetical protein